MKKILMACGVAVAVAGSMASCGSGSKAAPGSFEDSLCQAVGAMNGAQLSMQYAQIPEEMRAKFVKSEMLQGIKTVLMTDTTRQSYVTGMQIAMQLWGQIYMWEQSGIKVDRQALYKAFEAEFLADSVADPAAVMANGQKMMGRVNEIIMAQQQKRAEAEAEAKANSPESKKNIEAGEKYLAEQMKADPSIKRTPSGLAYKVVKEGTGEKAQASSRVTVDYTGRLIDGKVFDSSIERGEPTTFPVRGVIPGFAEGLQLMNNGAHYILYIPGNLAYGVDGTPDGSIGPNDMLVFDVEVKGIDTPKE